MNCFLAFGHLQFQGSNISWIQILQKLEESKFHVWLFKKKHVRVGQQHIRFCQFLLERKRWKKLIVRRKMRMRRILFSWRLSLASACSTSCSLCRISMTKLWNTSSTHFRRTADVSKKGHPSWRASAWPSSCFTWTKESCFNLMQTHFYQNARDLE